MVFSVAWRLTPIVIWLGETMSTVNFNRDSIDKETFAPFELINALDTKWKDVRLSFNAWNWLREFVGSDYVDDYYLNGYGVEGLVKACRLDIGLEVWPEGIEYDSEGDTCYIHFSRLDDAVQTAQLAAEMIKDRARIVAMSAIARENDFDN
jgi:hypothetical protein